MDYNSRFFKLYDTLKEKGYISTYVELAEILGTNKAGINDLKNGRKKISLDIILSMKNSYPFINIEWILTGDGDMLKNAGVNAGITHKIEENKPINYTENSNYEIVSESEKKLTVEKRKLIPFFDAVVQAGTQVIAEISNNLYPVEMVDAGDFFQDATAVMAVHGDSMSPDYHAGSLIAIKEVYDKRLVLFGQDYVLETSEYRVIKRLKQNMENRTYWIACSTNTEVWDDGPFKGQLIHEPFLVNIDDVLHLYLVIGKIERNHSSKISKL